MAFSRIFQSSFIICSIWVIKSVLCHHCKAGFLEVLKKAKIPISYYVLGAKELADHLLFLAGQNGKLADLLFRDCTTRTTMDPLSFALLMQISRLPGLSVGQRAVKQGQLKSFLQNRQLLFQRHAQLSKQAWCNTELSVLNCNDFLTQVAKWLPDTKQAILAAIDIAALMGNIPQLLECLFRERPFARRELLRRAGSLFPNWTLLSQIDAEIVAEFKVETSGALCESVMKSDIYLLPALKAASLPTALKAIEEYRPQFPIETLIEDDWSAIDDGGEAALIAALLRVQATSDELHARLLQLCELLWLGPEACPLNPEVKPHFSALALSFACGEGVDRSRLASLIHSDANNEVILDSQTANSLAKHLPILALPFATDPDAILSAGILTDTNLTILAMKSLTRLNLQLTEKVWTFACEVAENSISNPQLTKPLIGLLDSLQMGEPSDLPLQKLANVSDAGVIKAFARILSVINAGQQELIKAVILSFGAVGQDSETNVASQVPKDRLPATLFHGITMNERAAEAAFYSLLNYFQSGVNEADWIVKNASLLMADWKAFLQALLERLAEGIIELATALSTGLMGVKMQALLTSVYALTERLLEACPDNESLTGWLEFVAVQLTRRVYILLPLQEASITVLNNGNKKRAKGEASQVASSSSAAATLIFTLERFEGKFLARRLAAGREELSWPQNLPRSTCRDYKILLESLK